MKKVLTFGIPVVALGILVVAGVLLLTSEKGQFCLSQDPGNFIGCVFAPGVALTVSVSGSVDEVMILRDGDDQVIARIITNGQDVKETVRLSTEYRYYLSIRKGAEQRTGTPHGFSTSETAGQLEIFTIDHWEGPL